MRFEKSLEILMMDFPAISYETAQGTSIRSLTYYCDLHWKILQTPPSDSGSEEGYERGYDQLSTCTCVSSQEESIFWQRILTSAVSQLTWSNSHVRREMQFSKSRGQNISPSFQFRDASGLFFLMPESLLPKPFHIRFPLYWSGPLFNDLKHWRHWHFSPYCSDSV